MLSSLAHPTPLAHKAVRVGRTSSARVACDASRAGDGLNKTPFNNQARKGDSSSRWQGVPSAQAARQQRPQVGLGAAWASEGAVHLPDKQGSTSSSLTLPSCSACRAPHLPSSARRRALLPPGKAGRGCCLARRRCRRRSLPAIALLAPATPLQLPPTSASPAPPLPSAAPAAAPAT